MSEAPTISVIVPCYNSEAFIAHTLASLQDQTYPDWEAIVINDGSTDTTEEIVRDWMQRDKRIHLISQGNHGLAKARNVGILNSRGKIIHFLDSDDWMLGTAYDSMMARMIKEPALSAVYCGTTLATEDGLVTAHLRRSLKDTIDFASIAVRNQFPVNALLIKRGVLDVVGLFDETLRHCHDWDLWGRILRCGFRLAPVQEPFAVYRMVRASLSSRHDTFWRTGLGVIERLYSRDSRCQQPLELWAEGAPNSQYPIAIKNWALFCLPRAILAEDLETMDEIVARLLADLRTCPQAAELSNSLFRGLALWNPAGPTAFPAVWRTRRDLLMHLLMRIGAVLGNPMYVNDVVGSLLWRVLRVLRGRQTAPIRETARFLIPFLLREARAWATGVWSAQGIKLNDFCLL